MTTTKENFECPLAFHLTTLNKNADSILIDGNTATALGCLYAGATVAGWYPITPATAVMDNFTRLCAKYRRVKIDNDDPNAPATYQNTTPHHPGRGRDRLDRHGARRVVEWREGLQPRPRVRGYRS